jgi:carboxymethylenebutenolidase
MDQDLTVTSTSDDTPPLAQIEIDQRVFDLYDEYCHGRMDR